MSESLWYVVPSTSIFSIKLRWRFEFAILWKNLILLSPSLSQRTRDFCRHEVSSKWAKFSRSRKWTRRRWFSKEDRPPEHFLLFKTSSLPRSWAYLNPTLPNSRWFHFLRSSFKVFNLHAKNKTRRTTKRVRRPPALNSVHKTFRLQPHIFKSKRNLTP